MKDRRETFGLLFFWRDIILLINPVFRGPEKERKQ
jgi:hypothetical protein